MNIINSLKLLFSEFIDIQSKFNFTLASKIILKPLFLRNEFAINRNKHEAILNYLRNNYSQIIEKYKDYKSPSSSLDSGFPIWVCWFQGEENMPELIRCCYNSIKKNSENHSVILITIDNFSDYVSVPDYILKKLDKKEISLTHFSDILRACLLAEKGGLWLDATIYLSDKINIENKIFFTTKQTPKDNYFVSNCKWTGYCIGAPKSNLLFMFLRDILFEYWRKEEYLINYLLIDYIIELAYLSFSDIKKMIDKNPINNNFIYFLQNKFNDEFKIEEFNEICEDTYIHKLTYKKEINIQIRNSYYSYLINNR